MDPFEEEPDEGEGWLVSYADMMTLIACFFILMMAFANFDPVGFNIKAEKLSKSFRVAKFKSSDIELTQITEEVARHELKDRTKISLKDSELIVKFSSSVIYENAQATLNQDSLETLDALIDVIKITNPHYRILIEGHADDTFKPEDRYQSNWEVSVARAAFVAERFAYFGFPKDRIVPIGRGDSRPVMEINAQEEEKERLEKQKLNRRVVIRLLEPYKKKKIKFGLGIYFKDATEDVKEDLIENEDVRDFKIE